MNRNAAEHSPRADAATGAKHEAGARVYQSGFYAYVLGGLSHGAMLALFVVLEQWVLAYFNIFSVVLFASACLLHMRRRYLTAFLMVISEVTAHGALATVVLGSEPGFYFYIASPPLAAWVAPFLTGPIRIAVTALCASVFAFFAAYSLMFDPMSTLADPWALGFKIANALGLLIVVVGWVGIYNRAVIRAEAALTAEHERSESLLLNILPASIAERLKGAPRIIGDQHDAATVLFADIVNFTEIARRLPATRLVDLLNAIFTEFDDLAEKHGLEKIKTIGDAYMAVAGLPQPQPDHAARAARYALEIRAAAAKHTDDRGAPIQIRVGINSGSVVAGVIGKSKFAYDLWGDAVNLAARMEESAEAGGIQVAPATHALLKDKFQLRSRDPVNVKGVGERTTSYLEGSEASADQQSDRVERE